MATRMAAPADDHVGPRPPRGRGCGPGRRAARWRACGTRPRPPRGSARSGGCDRGRSRRGRCSMAATVVTVPARPTRVAASAAGGIAAATSSSWSRTTDRRAASSSGCGRVVLQELSRSGARSRRRRETRRAGSRSAVPTANSVEPPPMSTTRNGPRAGRGRRSPRRTRAGPPRRPTAARARPRRSRLGRRRRSSSRLAASRAADVAVDAHARSTPWRSSTLAVLAQHRHGALDGLGSERAGRVDARAEPGDAHQPLDGARLAVAGDEQARRVRADVDGARRGRLMAPTRRCSATHRPTGSSPPARYQA